MCPRLDCIIENFDHLLCNVVRHGKLIICSCDPPKLGSLLRFYVSELRLTGYELVYAYVYLLKLQRHAQHIKRIQRCTKHRLLMAALAVAHKFLNDNSYKTSSWVTMCERGMYEGAFSIHVSLSQMARAERTLLELLDWDVWVKVEDMTAVLKTWFGCCDTYMYECRPRIAMRRSTPRKKRISIQREQAHLGAEFLDVTGRETVTIT